MQESLKSASLKAREMLAKLPEEKDRALGILNGVLGDKLPESLAVEMAFYHNKQKIELNKKALKEYKTQKKICIFLHGNSDFEETWKFKSGEDSYGHRLKNEFAYTPFYLRYNSGLHISENGKAFARLMQDLLDNSPTKIKDIIIIAHSMGGLVTRSAEYYAEKQHLVWHKKLSKVFFLGTPHDGALLEKAGSLTSDVLGLFSNFYTRTAQKMINVRSAGIQDLSHGYLVEEDWSRPRSGKLKSKKTEIGLFEHVEYFGIASTLTKSTDSFIARYLGDGMVHPKTAQSSIKEENFLVMPQISHLGLVTNDKVYSQIKTWLTDS